LKLDAKKLFFVVLYFSFTKATTFRNGAKSFIAAIFHLILYLKSPKKYDLIPIKRLSNAKIPVNFTSLISALLAITNKINTRQTSVHWPSPSEAAERRRKNND
jgi:hypothetical protein